VVYYYDKAELILNVPFFAIRTSIRTGTGIMSTLRKKIGLGTAKIGFFLLKMFDLRVYAIFIH
jgi:hypothetical protein